MSPCKRHQWSEPLDKSKGTKRRDRHGHYAIHVTRRCLKCGELKTKTEKRA